MRPPSNDRRDLRTPLLPIVAGLVLTVYLSRFFCVAESASQGETLWIVCAWFFALFCWSIAEWKLPSTPLRPGWLDLSVILMAGGHLLSALIVIGTTGEKRSATVCALTDAVLYEITKENIAILLETYPEIAGVLAQTIAERQLQNSTAAAQFLAETRAQQKQTMAEQLMRSMTKFFGRMFRAA